MAYLDGFGHDIFISYAHIDDDPDLFAGGWITQFERKFRAALRSRLGHEPGLAFDAALAPNASIQDLITWAKNSAVLVIIGSRNWINRPFTQRELQSFEESAAGHDRFFLIELLPLHTGNEYPGRIAQNKRVLFYDHDTHAEPVTISPTDPRFVPMIGQLAEKVVRQLITMRASPAAYAPALRPAPVAAQPVAANPAPATGRRTVLLAEHAGDTFDEHGRVRAYLEDYDITVLPETGYPQGGAEFEARFRADAARADVFVQLLGKYPGRYPPDLPDGYQVRQYDLAHECGLEIMQWRHPEIDPDTIADLKYRGLLLGATTHAESLNEFTASMVRKVTAPPPVVAAATGPASMLAFVNAEPRDLPLAREISERLIAATGADGRDVKVILPAFYTTSSENRSYVRSHYGDSDALFFVYGEAHPGWVQQQYAEYIKTCRGQVPKKLVAICLCPPEEKPDIGIFDKSLVQVDLRTRDMSALETLRDALFL